MRRPADACPGLLLDSRQPPPLIQGVNLVVISVIVVINLTIDALYAVLDPRIRY